jgi:phosphate starvation-inducible membrane PsiE
MTMSLQSGDDRSGRDAPAGVPEMHANPARPIVGVKSRIDRFGNSLVNAFQLAALFIIGATIVWSTAHEYIGMMNAGRAKLDEILLLFIYLELGAMVGIYFKTDRLPVLFLLYVAITSLTRYLAVDSKDLDIQTIIVVTGSILALALAVLVLQIAASKFQPLNRHAEASLDTDPDPGESKHAVRTGVG